MRVSRTMDSASDSKSLTCNIAKYACKHVCARECLCVCVYVYVNVSVSVSVCVQTTCSTHFFSSLESGVHPDKTCHETREKE